MTTAGDLVSQASSQLHGWGGTQDRVTPLTSGITPTASQFTVDFASGQAVGITPGVVEIDSEQLYVTSVDASTGICKLATGFGRGYNNTTATTHAAGAKVVSRPRFPRAELFKQLNHVLGSVYPQLFAVKSHSTTVATTGSVYALPDIATRIINAQWQDPLGQWQDCRGYTIDPFDGNFRLTSSAMTGQPLRIIYAIEPTQFATEADDFSVTGLPPTCADVLILGTVAYQVPALDISRAQLSSMESTNRSQVVPSNAGVSIGKYLMAEFQMRLDNEATSLRKRYRPRMVRVS